MNYPHITKDSRGNQIHIKMKCGYESWAKYDENNRRIHFKNNYGIEFWQKFDQDGHLSYYKHSNGVEQWYNEKGETIPSPTLVKEVTMEEIAKNTVSE